MCQKRSSVLRRIAGKDVRLDSCIVPIVQDLSDNGVHTLACCCGHGKYNLTVVAKKGRRIYEVYTDVTIPRAKRFYFRDKEGFFFIPECAKEVVR